MTRSRRRRTVLRDGLREDSALQEAVQDGLGAVRDPHREYFDPSVRTSFDDSLDLDEAMRSEHPDENRWDYLVGHATSGEIVAVEPHSAKQDEISTVVRKLAAAKRHIRPHLRDGVSVARWLWVASGNVQFVDMEKTTFQLADRGITFVGRRVLAKHLPAHAGGGEGSRRIREGRARRAHSRGRRQ